MLWLWGSQGRHCRSPVAPCATHPLPPPPGPPAAGGGACEMAISRALSDAAPSISGVEQWPYKCARPPAPAWPLSCLACLPACLACPPGAVVAPAGNPTPAPGCPRASPAPSHARPLTRPPPHTHPQGGGPGHGGHPAHAGAELRRQRDQDAHQAARQARRGAGLQVRRRPGCGLAACGLAACGLGAGWLEGWGAGRKVQPAGSSARLHPAPCTLHLCSCLWPPPPSALTAACLLLLPCPRSFGIDGNSGEIRDMREAGVWEPYQVKVGGGGEGGLGAWGMGAWGWWMGVVDRPGGGPGASRSARSQPLPSSLPPPPQSPTPSKPTPTHPPLTLTPPPRRPRPSRPPSRAPPCCCASTTS
jgi:hypothetical protein